MVDARLKTQAHFVRQVEGLLASLVYKRGSYNLFNSWFTIDRCAAVNFRVIDTYSRAVIEATPLALTHPPVYPQLLGQK